MKRSLYIAFVVIVIVPAVAMLPVARVVVDWVRVSTMINADVVQASTHGYDWIFWQDSDGLIQATYVFPRGPAWEAGVRKGDVFFELNYQQFFNAGDLRHAIEGIAPGSVNTFSLLRDGQIIEANVRFTRYPTFLYPASTPLWQFAIWGFTLGAFLHILGLAIAAPLARRSREGWSSLVLILVSSLWMFANLLRLWMVEVLGPPLNPGGLLDTTWQALTLVGLFGWIGFPALLLEKVLRDSELVPPRRLTLARVLLYFPACVLLLVATTTTLRGNMGPFTQAGLIGPILFHTCWYIATAAGIVLLDHFLNRTRRAEPLGGWNLAGSAITLTLGLLATLSAIGVLPVLGSENGLAAWLIVWTQLLSVAPVLLVTVATLKHGKVDQVVSRGLTYFTVLGLIFFSFVAGMSLLEPYLTYTDASHDVVAGLFVVVLLIVFERLARRMRVYAENFFATERQRTRQTLIRFQDQMRTATSPATLLQQTVQTVGEAFDAKSAALFLRANGSHGPWMSGTYHPEPPYFTERLVQVIWPHIEREGQIWAHNPEINESSLPRDLTRLLEERGAALAVPILGELEPVGLLILAPKKIRRAVYNLEDLDLLRSLGGQLAMAVDRLDLIEREQALKQESAEAQLVALRAQINPHFLFNALNTIISLISERPEEAETTVEHLASIFRHILQTSSRPYVTLDEEMALVAHYLEIEQARFGQNLTIEVMIDPALGATPVPAFVVQTLVENAVKHGLERKRGGGLLRISARQLGPEWAEITVEDTGVGIPSLFDPVTASQNERFYGIGLQNVYARLERLYGHRDLLRISSDPELGTRATLRLPVPPLPTSNVQPEVGLPRSELAG
ncbi:MAG TPA: histidine kinase [Rhodothermales bacterium]|nr:histidine kinase [Rhodothermales bacterium]